jgi:hypothetical protein
MNTLNIVETEEVNTEQLLMLKGVQIKLNRDLNIEMPIIQKKITKIMNMKELKMLKLIETK